MVQLTEIRMRLNYLHGTIPPQWTAMENMEMFGGANNAFTGPLPVSNSTQRVPGNFCSMQVSLAWIGLCLMVAGRTAVTLQRLYD